MEDRDTKGDLYEYMLGKIATAGQNGQFRTPRHIIRLMVEMTAPQPTDVICDPACGTAGFLVAAGEYLREHHPNILHDAKLREHFHHRMFHGFDFDNTMLRIGSMNMLLHGVENPDIRYRDSLAQDHAGDEEKYTLVLANPPFAGSLDYENTAKDLLQIVKTKKTELLFLALFLRLLKPGGRAAVIVPDGVLFGSSKAHKELRRMLVEEQKLDAVISLPGGVFKPYAGVSTAILLFTKTNSGGTDHVWFYDVEADGWSLDDKRTPLLPEDKLGPVPRTALDRGRARQEQPARRAGALGRAQRRRARTPAHRAELLRAQGRHRRAGLRPLAQPLQGSGARGGRAPRAEGDPRRAGEAGGGDPAGDEGVGGDAEMSGCADHRRSARSCDMSRDRSTPTTFRTRCRSSAAFRLTIAVSREVVPARRSDLQAVVEPGDVLLRQIVPHIRAMSWLAAIGRPASSSRSLPAEWIAVRELTELHPAYRAALSLSAIRSDAAVQSTVSESAAHDSSIVKRMLADSEIPLPPLPEQRRIAEILDKADALRAKRRAALAQLDTLTQSIFLDMFGDPATNPKGWPQKRVGRLVRPSRLATHRLARTVATMAMLSSG